MGSSNPLMNRDVMFQSFPFIETERCILQETSLSNAEDLFRIRSNVNGARFGPAPWSKLKQAEDCIREWHAWFHKKEDIPWGIYLRSDNRFIGHIRYAYIRPYLGRIGFVTCTRTR